MRRNPGVSSENATRDVYMMMTGRPVSRGPQASSSTDTGARGGNDQAPPTSSATTTEKNWSFHRAKQTATRGTQSQEATTPSRTTHWPKFHYTAPATIVREKAATASRRTNQLFRWPRQTATYHRRKPSTWTQEKSITSHCTSRKAEKNWSNSAAISQKNTTTRVWWDVTDVIANFSHCYVNGIIVVFKSGQSYSWIRF